MKKLLCLLLCLALLCAAALCEEGSPAETLGPEELAYCALPIMQSLLMCSRLTSFEEAPTEELAAEAVAAYRLVLDDQDLDDAEIYFILFANGELKQPDEAAEPSLTPVEVEVDSAIDCGDGTVKVSLTVYAQEDESYEFYCLVDVYLLPDPGAPCMSRICRVFFPE